MKTLKTGDECARPNNECVCVTNELILTQDRVDREKKNHKKSHKDFTRKT